MEETKILIGRLRTAAHRLRSDSTLYTVAELMEEAADMLEKYDGYCCEHVLSSFELLNAVSDVTCDRCAKKIQDLKRSFFD